MALSVVGVTHRSLRVSFISTPLAMYDCCKDVKEGDFSLFFFRAISGSFMSRSHCLKMKWPFGRNCGEKEMKSGGAALTHKNGRMCERELGKYHYYVGGVAAHTLILHVDE